MEIGNVDSAAEEWRAPEIHDVDGDAEFGELLRHYQGCRRIDTVHYIASDVFDLHHPDQMHDDGARAAFVAEIVQQGPRFGHWVFYPWLDALVRVADADLHYGLRTYRNRNLVTARQQLRLRRSRIAVFGLSVGSNVVERTVQAGIGDEYLLFDYDRLSPTNLNRIQASVADVGLLKTTIAGRKIAGCDPFIAQHHYLTGYDHATDDVLRANRPDVIIEEVDDLGVKARIRRIAAELRVPLVMAGDVGDKSTLDVERYDTGSARPFNGKLTDDEAQRLALGATHADEELGLLVKIIGQQNISNALLESVMLKGKELAGTPQLGTTAAVGGALASVAIRDILLGLDVPSGGNVVDVSDHGGSA